MTPIFLEVHEDGTPITCKFCHKQIWWDKLGDRVYDVGGLTLHVENCSLRREHFRQQAFERSEAQRQRRGHR